MNQLINKRNEAFIAKKEGLFMSAKYSKVIIEDITSNGLSEDEISLLVDVFCRSVLKVKSILAVKAEFDLAQLFTTKNTRLARGKLVISLSSQVGNQIWIGELKSSSKILRISSSVE